MLIVSGVAEDSCQSLDPHTGQNMQVIVRPLSAVRVHTEALPRVTRNVARGTKNVMPNADADCFRHSAQWQT